MRMPGYPAGVPSQFSVHVHPWPTRFHGPIYTRPVFGLPYAQSPYAVFKAGDFSATATAGLGYDALDWVTNPWGNLIADAVTSDDPAAAPPAAPAPSPAPVPTPAPAPVTAKASSPWPAVITLGVVGAVVYFAVRKS